MEVTLRQRLLCVWLLSETRDEHRAVVVRLVFELQLWPLDVLAVDKPVVPSALTGNLRRKSKKKQKKTLISYGCIARTVSLYICGIYTFVLFQLATSAVPCCTPEGRIGVWWSSTPDASSSSVLYSRRVNGSAQHTSTHHSL